MVCNAVEVRKTSSSETQLFWNKLQAAYAKGEPYTGPLYIEGKASLKTKNLKVSDVEVVIDKPRDDGQKKTNLHFKLVASFDEVYVQQYILDMPFIKGREFDYRVVSECGSNGVELQFSLTYDVKEAEYSHSRKQTVLRCHENTEENIMPIMVNILPATGSKKRTRSSKALEGWEGLLGAALRKRF